MTVRIIGGNLRDLSYIAANLRPEDHAEVDCQFDEWTPAQLALSAMQGFSYVVELGGNPEAAFGAGELRSGLWVAWSWGSKRMRRCVPRITEFFYAVLGPDVAAKGAWRVEARSMAGNDLAARWLKRLGATERCELPGYGRNGEDFILWDWTRESWSSLTPDVGGDHLLHVKATSPEASPANTHGRGQRRTGPRGGLAPAIAEQ